MLQCTADACGISLRTVQGIKTQVREVTKTIDDNSQDDGVEEVMEGVDEDRPDQAAVHHNVILHTPKKSTTRERKVTGLDDFDKAAIRRHILLAYYDQKEVPTIRKLLVTLKEAGLFSGSFRSLRKVIMELGFNYKQFNKRNILIEKPSVT